MPFAEIVISGMHAEICPRGVTTLGTIRNRLTPGGRKRMPTRYELRPFGTVVTGF